MKKLTLTKISLQKESLGILSNQPSDIGIANDQITVPCAIPDPGQNTRQNPGFWDDTPTFSDNCFGFTGFTTFGQCCEWCGFWHETDGGVGYTQ